MTLKERLERGAWLAEKNSGSVRVTETISGHDCRVLLALLKAAKDFHDASQRFDSSTYYASRGTLLNAIHAI